MELGRTIQELKVGDQASFAKTITETDIYNFAGVTGDFNPIHVNEPYANSTFFKARIAHGLLSASLISNVLGNILPGAGAVYKKQDYRFLKPVKIGDTIEANVEVEELNTENNMVKMKTWCINQNGDKVVEGSAWMIPVTKREKERANAV